MGEERRRIGFTLFTMLLLAALNVVGAVTHAGWRLAAFNTTLILALDVAFVLRHRDGVLLRWLLLGLAAGWLELASDAWMVSSTGTLVYPPGEPMIWDSPVYMPFAWTMVLAQLGVVADWLRARLPFVAATLLTALVSGLNIPLYEHLAKEANYWSYTQTPMLGSAPYYMIVFEFLLALPLVWLGAAAVRRPWPWSLLLGAFAGAWMLPAVVGAWYLLGPCAGARVQLARR